MPPTMSHVLRMKGVRKDTDSVHLAQDKNDKPGHTNCAILSAMFEILCLLVIIWLVPPSGGHILWLPLGVLIVLPRLYGMWKGAPYVPTSGITMRRMFDLADIKKGDLVYDLGCGDGRLVFAAAKKGARAIGFECSIPTYLLAKLRSFFHPGASVRFRDFWKQDYTNADIILCYLLTTTMQTFKAVVWPQLKPGCRVVSHSFKMEGIEPSKVLENAVLYVK